MKLSHRMWSAGLVWVALGGAILGGAAAVQAADEPRAQLDQAYQQTKTAKTSSELSAIIATCERALEQKLSEQHQAYARQLLAWTLNRRGEGYNEQAAAMQDEAEAERLDAAALADFDAAVRHDPSRWKSWHNRGVSRALLGQYPEALHDFDKVVELKPDYPNAWFNRAELRLELRQFTVAAEDYTHALRLQPDDPAALLGRGRAYLGEGLWDLAIADFDQVLQQEPTRAAALAYRGEARQAQGAWEAAAADIREAVKLDPQTAQGFLALGWLMATCPEDRFRQPDLAVQAAEKGVQLEGEQAVRPLDVLAAALANAGRFEEAEATLEKALPHAPPGELADLQQRLQLYRDRKPFRQRVPQATASSPSRIPVPNKLR